MKISVLIYTLILLLSISVLLTTGCEADPPEVMVNFVKKTSMPGNGRASAVSFAVNGKGYIALGRDANSVQLNDCWEYDPSTDSWQQKSSFPGIARVKATAAILNGRVYIGLGHNNYSGVYNSNSCLKDYWEFTPETDSWRRLADFPSNFTDACVSFVHNDEVFVANGFSEADYGGEIWKYQPNEDKWYRLKNFEGKWRFGGVVCYNEQHIFFGTGFKVGNCNDWWEYHPESDSWKKLSAMPDKGRVNAVSLTINNRYFVSTGRHFGGNPGRGHLKSDLMEYDSEKNTWYKAGELPNENRENAVSFVIDGTGYIGLGENDNKVLNDFWSFEP